MSITTPFKTLIEMLEYRAKLHGEDVAFTFSGEPVTYGKMWGEISRFGAYLRGFGVARGTRVVLSLPNSPAFFTAFYGIQRAGGTAVPLNPGSGPERLFALASACEAKAIIIPDHIHQKIIAGLKKMGAERGYPVLTVSESAQTPVMVNPPEVRPEDCAFIQYTSGSTGNPKGVQLSHDNLLTNIAQMIIGMGITSDDIFVSWLPVYHDMGLILMTMTPFYTGTVTHLLPTNLKDITPWLESIQNHRGTFTAAPDFAYRLCLKQSTPDAFDLSSLRMALNAAEKVRASTIEEFETVFGLHGVMVSGYGLAEATVGVTTWHPGSKPRVDERGFVSVGPPFPGVEIKIMGEEGKMPAGEVGEITIKSEANSLGYFRNPAETARLFNEDGYLNSGDLGYLDEDGYLYFVSRKKNIIKRSGETISPHEIEEVVDQIPAVRFSAAIGVDLNRWEDEQVYVFAEIRDGEILSENDRFDMVLEIINAIKAHLGYRPGRVYLLSQHAIPMTYNGKVQHGLLKEMYMDGSLRDKGRILYPEY